MRGLSLVAASGDHSSSRCVGLSLSRPLLLRSTDSRRAGSVVVTHGPSRSAARGIFPDQGSNSCPLHWQADSQPLCHQGSPRHILFFRSESVSLALSQERGHRGVNIMQKLGVYGAILEAAYHNVCICVYVGVYMCFQGHWVVRGCTWYGAKRV